MKKTLAALGCGVLALTACGTAPDDLTRDERVQIDSKCMSASGSDVYDEWGYDGDWTTFGEWDVEKSDGGFLTSGHFDSDMSGPIPVSCDIDYPEIEVASHEVGTPDIDFKRAAIDACHESVLDEARYPADVEFVTTEIGESTSLVTAGGRQLSVSGDVDMPNAFGAKQRMGYLCAAVIINQDGTPRFAKSMVNEYLRS